eukprot:bmy_04370T0
MGAATGFGGIRLYLAPAPPPPLPVGSQARVPVGALSSSAITALWFFAECDMVTSSFYLKGSETEACRWKYLIFHVGNQSEFKSENIESSTDLSKLMLKKAIMLKFHFEVVTLASYSFDEHLTEHLTGSDRGQETRALQVKYKRDFEESKGRGFSIVTDTPELQRLKRTQEQISNILLYLLGRIYTFFSFPIVKAAL